MSICQFTTRGFYWALLENVARIPTAFNFWRGFNANIQYKDIWKPNYSYKPPECIQLDYKISHNVVFTMKKLKLIGYVETDLCCLCKSEIEDICHLFIYCSHLRTLLDCLAKMVEDLFRYVPTYVLNDNNFQSMLLFGYHKRDKKICLPFLNLMLSCARYAIWKRRNLCLHEKKLFNVEQLFKAKFKDLLKTIKFNLYSKQSSEMFRAQFLLHNPYLGIDNDEKLVLKF